MMDLGKWAFANKKLVYFLLAVLVGGGLLSIYDMSKLEDPGNQGQTGRWSLRSTRGHRPTKSRWR